MGQKPYQRLPGAEPSGLTAKGPEGTFGDDANVLYLDCSDSNMTVCIC